jgi:hypothetical protein
MAKSKTNEIVPNNNLPEVKFNSILEPESSIL